MKVSIEKTKFKPILITLECIDDLNNLRTLTTEIANNSGLSYSLTQFARQLYIDIKVALESDV